MIPEKLKKRRNYQTTTHNNIYQASYPSSALQQGENPKFPQLLQLQKGVKMNVSFWRASNKRITYTSTQRGSQTVKGVPGSEEEGGGEPIPGESRSNGGDSSAREKARHWWRSKNEWESDSVERWE